MLQHKSIQKLNLILLTLFSIFILIVFYKHLQIILFPHQGEYREGTSLLIAKLLLEHVNPFTVANVITANTAYGVFYSWVCVFFAKLCGLSQNLLLNNRLVSGLSIIATLLLMFKVNKENNCTLTTNVGLLSIFYVACFTPYVIYGTVLGQPGSLGLFLMLLSLYFPLKYHFKTFSLSISAFLVILCFLTKPYFIIALLSLSLYLFLFVSKFRAFLYCGLVALIFSVMALFIEHIYPLYFFETVYVPSHLSTDFSAANVQSMLSQLQFFSIHYGLFLLLGLFLCWKYHFRTKRSIAKCKLSFLNFRLSEPLLNFKVDFYIFAFIVSLIIFVLKLGLNQGAWMEYVIHLILPFLLLYIGKYDDLLTQLQRALTNILILVNGFWLCFTAFSYHITTGELQWQNLDTLIKTHNNIFASPALTTLLVKENKPIYFSGQTTYLLDPSLFNNHGKKTFVPADIQTTLNQKVMQFQENILAQIREKKFNVVILDGYDMSNSSDLYKQMEIPLAQNYRLVQTMQLTMPISSEIVPLYIYLPLNEKYE